MNPFGEQLWWLVARSSGIVALVVACMSVVWGLLLSSKYLQGAAKPRRLLDLHRYLGGVSVLATLVHMLALWADSFVNFRLVDLLVPFVGAWSPLTAALGIAAFWLLLLVQGSSMIMHRIPRRWWKLIHLTSYLVVGGGFAHALLAGTDAGALWFQMGTGGLIGGITFLTAWRAWMVPRRGGSRRVAAPEPIELDAVR